jgi:hypothetical protein
MIDCCATPHSCASAQATTPFIQGRRNVAPQRGGGSTRRFDARRQLRVRVRPTMSYIAHTSSTQSHHLLCTHTLHTTRSF